ncbi:hypothetical protein COY52_08770 [Candidatus Desantisbacteria bacterium CG_4_10_14_0_8_um_filter_48_22]|uniref:Periplasmic heavy metal sensor n=1 Tax=Candidatus Desantisbacteria bacterium CG_4_10_14_0_8_um_filter_48_22 TaxID=1974543 RepID=A0A2M7S8G5_9BACT|nr:MAG: hypothetical protein AUJ67_09715 [Candidatus Desantisbacteria bacterium CG1_02_49_89]PIV57306.1 MAG: hypothetical protein COS16_00885 [Candidatus Desantisbacteria bacterium CG02_land_8_20_14_3_00_49_13]PIZ15812.1 MAG: hypothetical protein COY52_08770 [Candidatus Desantisbacteria bacterium CG_4_10_14_0_8_um_filter_48_22]PJB27592.1 MAG: hypothetical protein CO111_04520 [Candidatus Desantisbacteria bacterium CG_4_9_14_3_um_filter_50_7]
MNRRFTSKPIYLFLIIFLFAAALNAAAQVGPPWPEKDKKPEQKGNPAPPAEEQGYKKEELREMLETLRVWKMTKALELTEEQSLKIFPRMNEIEKAREAAGKVRAQAAEELKKMVNSPAGPDREKISEKLAGIEKAESELRSKEEKFREEIKSLLSPVQQAKLVIFLKDFEEDVKRMVAEVRGMRKEAAEKKMQQKRK